MLVFPLVLIAYHRESIARWVCGGEVADRGAGGGRRNSVSLLTYWLLFRQFHFPAVDHLLLSVVLWGPAAEEMLFRAYLQPEMESRTGRWGGLVITSLLFGITHLPRIYLRQGRHPSSSRKPSLWICIRSDPR